MSNKTDKNTATVDVEKELNEAQAALDAVKLPENREPAALANIVEAALDAAENEDTGSDTQVDFKPEDITRYAKLFPVLSLPNVARTVDGAKSLKEWGKDRTADGEAFLTDRKSPRKFAFSLLDDPDEESENADDNRAVRVQFKASYGLESTVMAALKALTVESNNSIEKTWWTDDSKGFSVSTNGVGKAKDGIGKTVTSGKWTGKTVDTTGRLKKMVSLINKAANHLQNDKPADSLRIFLVLQGKLPATQDGAFDFFLTASDAIAAIKARHYGLARLRAYKEAKAITDEIEAKRVASMKSMQERAQAERDAEREQRTRESLARQRGYDLPNTQAQAATSNAD